MGKILLFSFLISCSAILFAPMVVEAAACTLCQTATTLATCECGGVTINTGSCCTLTGGTYPSQGQCIQLCVAGGAGGSTGPLSGCTLTRDVGVTGCPASGDCPFTTSQCGICCLLHTLYKITDWIFVILVGLAGLFVIIGAFNLLMSAGDSAKIKSGREYIMYAAIGLIVGFLARAIPAIVRLAVGA